MEPWIFVFEKNCAYKKLLIKKPPESIFFNAFKVYRFVASLWKKIIIHIVMLNLSL